MKEFLYKLFFIFVFQFISHSVLGDEIISSIKVEIHGAPTVGESFIRQNLQVQEKSIYEPRLIDKSIHNLMETDVSKM